MAPSQIDIRHTKVYRSFMDIESFNFDFSPQKNRSLKEIRNISFEEVIAIIETTGVIDIVSHPNQAKYPNQKIYIVAIGAYMYLVPFVESGDRIFLKTIIPSRKATQYYRKELQ